MVYWGNSLSCSVSFLKHQSVVKSEICFLDNNFLNPVISLCLNVAESIYINSLKRQQHLICGSRANVNPQNMHI